MTVAACAPAAAPIDAAPPALTGQKVSDLVAKLGPPGSQQQVDGRNVYTWESEIRAPLTPVPSTSVSYAAGRPNTVDTLALPMQGEREICVLRAVVDGAGTVLSSDWQGPRAACFALSRKLAGKG
ncbi:MAG: hypothetical protein EPO67_05370 [Reyranella sp.]|nr:MAG: hypothetical protein EPO67_05370 [Reyranella sp.]